MSNNENKERIMDVLAHFVQKRISYALRKIVLFDDEDLHSLHDEEQPIKHYDLECQAISSIEGILKQKILNEKIRAFHAIKIYPLKVSRKNVPAKKYRVTDSDMYKKNPTFFQNSSMNRLRTSIQSEQPLVRIRTGMDFVDRNCPQQMHNHKNQDLLAYEESISGIMNRLHEINRVGSPRYYDYNTSTPMSRYTSTSDIYPGHRQSKRMFIMEKLNNLERDVGDLVGRGENYQSKSRNLGSYQMITPSTKSSRNFQRVPGGYTRISEDIY